MGAPLLHVDATVLCAHPGGQVKATAPNPRVKVGGQATVLQTAPWTISGCSFSLPSGPMPCVTAQWSTGTLRVTSGNQPLLLQNSQATCIPNGTPVNIVVTQTRVTAT